MATKAKAKPKAGRKASGRSSAQAKAIRLKGKRVNVSSRNGSRTASKLTKRSGSRTSAAVKPAAARPAAPSSTRVVVPEKSRAKQFANAIEAYETAIKLMHAEQFQKAIRSFENLIAVHVEEPEIQERAKMLLHACEKKVQEKASRNAVRSADDHYNMGIADLNRRELGSAIEHLQHALKLTPKAEHVFYALATANALQGNRDQALQYLKQAIHYRPENRFLAARDADFEPLQEDADFKHLVTNS